MTTSKLVSLGKLLIVIRNGLNAAQYDELLEDSMLPISRIETISAGVIDFERVKYAKVSEAEKTKYQMHSGDILFSHINSPAHIGKTAIFRSDQALIHGVNLLLLRPDPKRCYPEYLNYYLKTFDVRAWFRARCKKAVNQASLNQGDIKSIEVPLPPLPEQQHIAEVLSKADRLRRLRRTARELSDTYLQSVFAHLFGDPGGNPKKWDTVVIERVLSKDRAGAQTGPFGSSLKRHEYVEEGIPVWGIDNVRENEFVEERSLFITPSKYRELSRYTVEDGDILMSRAGTVGRMCVAYPTQHPSIIGTNLVRVDLETSVILPRYFTALFTYFANRIGQLSSGGTAYSFVNPRTLKSIEIPLPPLPLQQQFAHIVHKFERLRVQQREAERQSEHLFQTLLHQAFRGELMNER